MTAELLVRASWRLLQPVQRSVKVIHHVIFSLHNESLRLAHIHVDIFVQLSIQESCVHIHLVDMHLSLGSCGEQGSDATESGYRGKRLMVVDSLGLSVSLCHQPTLVPFSFTILNVLDLKDPLATDDLSSRGRFGKRPSVMLQQRIHLILCGVFWLHSWFSALLTQQHTGQKQ